MATTIIQTGSTQSSLATKLLIAAAIGGGLWYGNNKLKEYKKEQQQNEAGNDPNTNIALQIFQELDKNNPDDELLKQLFGQVKDLKAVSAAYKNVSGGKDMLTTLQGKTFVGADTVQAIMRILGVASGAVKPTSQTVQTASTNANKGKTVWIVTKAAVRVRRSPKAYSTTDLALKTAKNLGVPQNNIISTIQAGETAGFLDVKRWNDNGNKPFYDADKNTFFLPILIFVGDAKTLKPAFIAASEVYTVTAEKSPKLAVIYKTNDFNSSKELSGLGIAAKLM